MHLSAPLSQIIGNATNDSLKIGLNLNPNEQFIRSHDTATRGLIYSALIESTVLRPGNAILMECAQMKKLKIVLLSSALALGLGQAAHAVYSQDQLDSLKALVEAQDTDAILAFIRANPEVMAGNDALADALQEFSRSREGFLSGIFGARVPNLDFVPDLPDGVTSSAELSGSLSDFGS